MIGEDVSVTRKRLRDIIVRRQRGLPAVDDDLDVLIRIESAFVALDEAIAGGVAPGATRRSEGLEEMLGRLEDAAYDARNAADDVRRVLERLRGEMSRVAA